MVAIKWLIPLATVLHPCKLFPEKGGVFRLSSGCRSAGAKASPTGAPLSLTRGLEFHTPWLETSTSYLSHCPSVSHFFEKFSGSGVCFLFDFSFLRCLLFLLVLLCAFYVTLLSLSSHLFFSSFPWVQLNKVRACLLV